MYYLNYSDWVEYIESEYEKRTVQHRAKGSLSDEEKAGGLHAWFNRVAKRVEKINVELSRIKSLKFKGQSEIVELDLIATAMAKAFYPECYDKNRGIVIKATESGQTDFFGSRAIGKFLSNNWFGNEIVPIKAPNAYPSKDSEENPYYWIEICSAMQREYAVFRDIDDINYFIFTAGQNKEPSALVEYGIYIRDVQHLCLAFSILHGYSVAEYRELYRQACEIKVLGDADETATAQIVRERLGDYLVCGSKTNEDLLAAVQKYSGLLLHKTKESRRSLINKCLDIIIGNGETTAMSSKDIEYMMELDRSVRERLQRIHDNYLFQIDISTESGAGEADLRTYLRNRCGLNLVDFTYSDSDDATSDSIENALRCMLIIFRLNGIKTAERSYNNAADLIDDINDQLINCYMRPMDYTFDIDRASGSIINITHDMFDWVIVESLKFEQAVYEQNVSAWSMDDDSIWGETVMRYIRGGVETD
ncbi:MAG: hypothetical protein K2M47_01750 [Clostridiales bacterium]|nr:hypothetical protein [Clostridiales bacterium]